MYMKYKFQIYVFEICIILKVKFSLLAAPWHRHDASQDPDIRGLP